MRASKFMLGMVAILLAGCGKSIDSSDWRSTGDSQDEPGGEAALTGGSYTGEELVQAIATAATAGTDVHLKPGTYLLSQQIAMTHGGLTIIGHRTTIKANFRGGSIFYINPAFVVPQSTPPRMPYAKANRIGFRGLRFETNGLANAIFAANTNSLTIEDCEFVGQEPPPPYTGPSNVGDPQAVHLVNLSKVTNALIRDSLFKAEQTLLRIGGVRKKVEGSIDTFEASERVVVENSRFEEFVQSGITVEHSSHVTISNNFVSKPLLSVGARYPFIATQARPIDPSTGQPIANTLLEPVIHNLRVVDNDVVGVGSPWQKDVSNDGTSDQFSINYVSNPIVSGNRSALGGENGITVTNKSHHGIVSQNLTTKNDGNGIQISSENEDTFNVLTFGNQTVNDGVGLGVKPGSAHEERTLVGIYSQDGQQNSFWSNQIVDERPDPSDPNDHGRLKFGFLVYGATGSEVKPNKNSIVFVNTDGVRGITIQNSPPNAPLSYAWPQ